MATITLNPELEKTYVLLDEIGSGGGGTVFKAYHKRLQKEVVLKKIHTNLISGNIRAEADILKNLKSEYLPQVLDFFELDGDVYTVMDYIPGQSLKIYLKEYPRFSQGQVLKWFGQLCLAVEKLHSQKPPIIHGDIKPDNIMITPQGNICLIDFNVSGDFVNEDAAGYTVGYAAPEQVSSFQARKALLAERMSAGTAGAAADDRTAVLGQGDDATALLNPATARTESVFTPRSQSAPTVDVRSDIYSMGATMYHLLTGEKPGVNVIRPIDEYPIRIEEAFAHLIMKCLEQDPRKRFQSVPELYNAVQNVHKSGKRYKALLRRQLFTRLALTAAVIGFSLLSVFGWKRMREERQDQYLELVSEAQKAREKGDYDEVQELFQDAAALFPERGEAYLEVCLSLYEQRQYEEVVDFVNRKVLENVTGGSVLGEIYYICGDSCLELEEYDTAADAFSEALSYNNENPRYYQDYAIALARDGKTDEAMKKLNKAVKYGLGNDSLFYTQGEIAWAQGDLDEAWDCFSDSIEESDDPYRKMRAYLMCSKVLEQQPSTEENVRRDVELLEKAAAELPDELSGAVLERLAQAYINMGSVTGDGAYDMQAVGVFEKIINYGWATYTTYQNIAILYQKNAMYGQGLALLEEMLKQFGENYNTYKRLAFVEAGAQSERAIESRDYSQFAEYYNRAVSLYQEQLSGNQTDTEMTVLQNLHDDVVRNGWIGR